MPYFRQALLSVKNNLVPIIICQKTKTSRNRVFGELSNRKKYSSGGLSDTLFVMKYKMSVIYKASPPR
jgi:hypothetical protein